MNMFSEKVKIEISPNETVGFRFDEQNLIVKKYFSTNEKIEFLNEYLSNITDITQTFAARYLIAEHALILQILDRCTNIDIESLDQEAIIGSELWEKIKSYITNYDEFRKDLDKVVSMWQAQESVGATFKNISDKLMEVLDNVSKMDVDKLETVANNFVSELDKLNERIPGIVENKSVRKRTRRTTKKTE